jgi:acyl dehydratase
VTESEPGLLEKMTSSEKKLYDEYRERLGKPFVPHHPHGIFMPFGTEDPVQWSLIKRWARINYDFNALWFDPEYAGKTRWGGVIAPPLYLIAMNDGMAMASDLAGALYTPGCRKDLIKYPNFRGSAMTNCDWEFMEPVRPGALLSTKSTAKDIFWRQGARYRLLFLFGEMEYLNQHEHRVALCQAGAVYMFK